MVFCTQLRPEGADSVSGGHSLVVNRQENPQLEFDEKGGLRHPHWVIAFTWFFYEGQEMPREIDLAKATRKFIFVCLLFCSLRGARKCLL